MVMRPAYAFFVGLTFALGTLTRGDAQAPPITPVITLPDSVQGDAGMPIEVVAKTNGRFVRWKPMTAGLGIVRAELLADSTMTVAFAAREGTYELMAYTALGDMPSLDATCKVIIGPAPGPTPVPPGPVPPGPTPIPVPVSGFRVIMVYESADSITREQENILYSSQVTGYLNDKTAKTDGRAGWRRWDKDVVTDNETETWKLLWTAVKPKLGKLPQLIVATGTQVYVLPWPASEAEMMTVLKTYGG